MGFWVPRDEISTHVRNCCKNDLALQPSHLLDLTEDAVRCVSYVPPTAFGPLENERKHLHKKLNQKNTDYLGNNPTLKPSYISIQLVAIGIPYRGKRQDFACLQRGRSVWMPLMTVPFFVVVEEIEFYRGYGMY